ncbi:NADH dehydrogenase [ubiquinone] 1 alpha subcomplex subunit 5 [Dermacentor andersoni]|uniref:NADH dehydrogenase [ubiquinone] 1 alpha subcomplex subunit 5 n=1 Tax=Dermacentor andersoni TaxID=34620 RepID=UPI002154FECE|nr:NADH dehydrogenase [ubiquinone] 1 alpha subcomplex subunit 5-like [Dermacentor andersoni]
MAGVIKKTTGLTGLAVCKNPHHELTIVYNKILRALAKLPESAAYRRYTEQIVNERLSLVQSEKDIVQLEKRIGAGQIEQVIKQAEGELVLARRMLNWKPWEPLIAKSPAGQWSWPPK